MTNLSVMKIYKKKLNTVSSYTDQDNYENNFWPYNKRKICIKRRVYKTYCTTLYILFEY